MLHDPANLSPLGKYQSTAYRYAALKAASRGFTDILLRKTNTKEIYVYKGSVVELEQPKVIERRGREIQYTKKPVVSFVRKFLYEGTTELDGPASRDGGPLAGVTAAAQ